MLNFRYSNYNINEVFLTYIKYNLFIKTKTKFAGADQALANFFVNFKIIKKII